MLIALLRFFWIGCCAVATLLQTFLLLDQSWAGQGVLVGFVFCATVFGYHFLRPEGWLRRLAFLNGFVAFGCLLGLPFQKALDLCLPALIWILYYFAGPRSLRRARFLKPLSIALVWAWVTVWLPLDWYQWREASLIFAGRAAFIFALALSYDLTDLHYDRHFGLPTLVQHLGEQDTFRWIDRTLLFAGLVSITNYLCKIYELRTMIALLLSLCFSAWWLRFLRRRPRWEHWHKFLIDALIVLQFLVVLLNEAIDTF